MAARTPPTTLWTAGQRVTASQLQYLMNPPMFSMYQSASQSTPNATDTQITMDVSEHDTDSGRSGSTPFAYTIPTGMGGRWRFTACVQWAGNATGSRQSKLFKNGSLMNAALSAGMAGPAGISTGYVISREILCAAGDVISVYGYQTSGGALNTNTGGSLNSFFEGQLISLANP